MSTSVNDTTPNEILSEILTLPLRGQPCPGSNGSFLTETLTINNKLKKDYLRPFLIAYHLPLSGNRNELLDRLRVFSQNQDEWSGMFPTVPKRKRGQVSGASASRQSAKHKKAAFQETTEVVVATIGGRQSLPKSDADRKQEDELCVAFVKKFSSTACMPTADSTTPAATTVTAVVNPLVNILANGSQGHLFDASPTLHQMNTTVQSLAEDLKCIKQQLSTHLPSAGSTLSDIGFIANSSSTCTVNQQLPSPVPTPAPESMFGDGDDYGSAPNSVQRVINIDGTAVYFTDKDLPEIPAVAFSANLTELFRFWNNTSCDYLKLKGFNIPPIHWRYLYAGRKARNWSRMKGKWMNWRNIMDERSRYPTDEAFWAVWSERDAQNGQTLQMSQTNILAQMTKARTDQEKVNADNARRFFAGMMDTEEAKRVFTYTKGGKVLERTMDKSVAENWCKLLEKNSVIAGRWLAQFQQA